MAKRRKMQTQNIEKQQQTKSSDKLLYFYMSSLSSMGTLRKRTIFFCSSPTDQHWFKNIFWNWLSITAKSMNIDTHTFILHISMDESVACMIHPVLSHLIFLCCCSAPFNLYWQRWSRRNLHIAVNNAIACERLCERGNGRWIESVKFILCCVGICAPSHQHRFINYCACKYLIE